MRTPQFSRAQTEAEHDRKYRLEMERLKTAQLLISKAAPALMVLFVCLAVIMSTRYLSGHSTEADIRFKTLIDLRANRTLSSILAVLLTGGGVTYGYQQRRLAKRKLAQASRKETNGLDGPSKSMRSKAGRKGAGQ